MTREELAGYIDHTNLKPEATSDDIKELCQEALEYNFASVCVNPIYVSLCAEQLIGSSVKVCSVVGFPLGATKTEQKVQETLAAIKDGAQEIDMVIAVGRLKEGDDRYVEQDIREVVEAASDKAIVKVIIETCLLTEEEKKRACQLAKNAGADFVKTSTGFNKAGATLEDVALMRKIVGAEMGVKAAGGIRDAKTALAMIEAGANRIGASSSVQIVKGLD